MSKAPRAKRLSLRDSIRKFAQQEAREVRLAYPEDAPSLIKLCVEMHSESGHHPLSLPNVQRLLERGIVRNQAILGVIGDPGDVRAMLLLAIERVYYSDSLHLMEIWNFVRQDSRRSVYGRQLLQFAIECADRTGLELMSAVIDDEKPEKKREMYERVLGSRGSVFIYRPGEK